MEKGFKSLTFAAGLMPIAGFILPWLEKDPFHYSGYSLAMLGCWVLLLFPLSGAAAAGLALIRSRPRAADLLYPGLAGLTALAVLIADLLFSDSVVLSLNRRGPWTEMIHLRDGSQLVRFHPVESLGFGLILCLLGTLMLCVLPLIFRRFLDETRLDQPLAFRKVIRPPTVLSGYRRFNLLAVCLVTLSVTWVWCGISPLKVWENRGHAKEYLFGRDLSQVDQAYIQDQINRAAQTQAMGRAQEYMSNKYRNLLFDQRPDFQEMEKERREKEKEILASMDPKEIRRLKQAAEKDALKEKQGGYFPPETSPEKIKGYIVALLETIAIAIWGTLLALVCAVPISFFAAQNTLEIILPGEDVKSGSSRKSISFMVRRLLDACRGFNEFVMALIFVAVIGLGPYAGILALWIHTFGILGKVFSEQIEAIESGQVEALTSTGASAAQTIAFSVMPQVMPVFVSYTLLRFESNVRSAAILGFVGAGGIGFLIFDKLNGYLFREVCTMMIIIIITVGIIDHLCSKIRMRFI
ncbi:phosphonate ABC transporter, permease protein PhnE [Desulfobacter curvatus]|uniref:phosphonate ABC transporter, permease protein PhnE n=1 Tax=Desulfobacter curvatus TaxID=2290 RepID=UPI000366C1E2|nr:phosphonate ABC transporter, permease protein PhnE [Desulfobacter curvatus]